MNNAAAAPRPNVPAPDQLAAEARADAGFLALLDRAGVSLIVTTAPHHIACFGCLDGKLTAAFTPCELGIGIAVDHTRLAVAQPREAVIFVPSTRLAQYYPPRPNRYDVIYVPVATFRTGGTNIHDMILDGRSVVFANTRFSCISRSDGTASFQTLWKPPFISAVMPQDRCHLNSFAMSGRRVRYATAFAASDAERGYRDMPLDSGVQIDVEANEIVADHLLKPHSVRLFNDELYVLNSAAGEVVQVDLAGRRSRVIAVLPGFTRGLHALDDVLLVGLSKMRPTAEHLDMPMARRHDELVSGIAAIDRRSGALRGMLHLPGQIIEVMDFVPVPGVRCGYVQDPAGQDPNVGIETTDGSYWMRAREAR